MNKHHININLSTEKAATQTDSDIKQHIEVQIITDYALNESRNIVTS